MSESLEITAKNQLLKRGQSQLAAHLGSLPPEKARRLAEQVLSIPWQELENRYEAPPFGEVAEIPVLRLAEQTEELRELGEKAYRNGQVAVFLLAGGAGTRLGFDGPKGCVKISGETTLYEHQARKVLEINELYGITTPLIVATSDVTHSGTVEHFENSNYFGLPAQSVNFVKQKSIPVFGLDGELLLESDETLLMSPNGNGGCLDALVESGLLPELQAQGISYLMHIQIDNAAAPAYDPGFVGFMQKQQLEVGVKVIELQDILSENLASVILNDGKVQFVEYSERDEDCLKFERDEKYLFRWGSPSLFCWSIEFLITETTASTNLPYHSVRKSLPSYSLQGCKLERFMFDLLNQSAMCPASGYEVAEAEFRPIKTEEDLKSPTSP